MIAFELHKKALDAAQRYTRAESDLIEILQKIDECRGYLNFGWKSLFEYTHQGLGLSESVTFNLITVARKAREVPALQEMIRAREITLSNARTIAPILTPENQEEWLPAASALSKRELERKVEERSPSPKKRLIELHLPEDLHQLLERAQELIEQKLSRPASLEETVRILAESYIRRHDPVVKAERSVLRRQTLAKEGVDGRTDDRTDGRTEGHTEVQMEVRKGDRVVARTVATDSTATAPGAAPALNARSPSEGNACFSSPAPSSLPVPGQVDPRKVPASLRHEVHRRDGGRCTHINPKGERCRDRRWIDIHHKIPLSQGGLTELSNLTTLCRGHHQMVHFYSGLS